MVKFGYTILYVSDVARSVAFYELSFGLQRKFITPENDYAELETGGTTLSFASKKLGNTNLKKGFIESSTDQQPFGIEIAFVTETIEAVIDNATKHGAILAEAPVTKPWGQTVAYLRDIDGFLIEICTPVSTN